MKKKKKKRKKKITIIIKKGEKKKKRRFIFDKTPPLGSSGCFWQLLLLNGTTAPYQFQCVNVDLMSCAQG